MRVCDPRTFWFLDISVGGVPLKMVCIGATVLFALALVLPGLSIIDASPLVIGVLTVVYTLGLFVMVSLSHCVA